MEFLHPPHRQLGYHVFTPGVNVMWCLRNAFVLVVLSTSLAHADAIDGDWCNQDGSQIFIDGNSIRLTDGTVVTGVYTRHKFSYVAPPGDFEAGREILFVQRSEEEMRRVRDPQAMPEHADIWQRCRNTSAVPKRIRSALDEAQS
jgi:hypothetical protein